MPSFFQINQSGLLSAPLYFSATATYATALLKKQWHCDTKHCVKTLIDDFFSLTEGSHILKGDENGNACSLCSEERGKGGHR